MAAANKEPRTCQRRSCGKRYTPKPIGDNGLCPSCNARDSKRDERIRRQYPDAGPALFPEGDPRA